MNHVVYDLETYPNWFLARFIHADTGTTWTYELSDRRDDLAGLVAFGELLVERRPRMVGFNNEDFDYPLLHLILKTRGWGIDVAVMYAEAQRIIGGQRGRFRSVAPWEVLVPQLDLFKIHHFDRNRCSLKQIEFVQRARSVEDLPFPVGTILTPEQMQIGCDYNLNDIANTLEFFHDPQVQAAIELRDELTARTGVDMTNFSDVKIGNKYFVMRMEARQPGICYDPATREPRNTYRREIRIADVILPVVRFEHPELQRVLRWLRAQVVTQTRGGFADPESAAVINGFELRIEKGGIHGSVLSRTIRADDDWCIYDVDTGAYYPSVAIANDLHPEHLGPLFNEVARELAAERKLHKKGSAENQMLKLANNGATFGQAGSPFSPFYDPKYLLAITINGQLLLCMLAEQLLKLVDHGFEMIQINTDGMTMRCRRSLLPHVRDVCAWWQGVTRLTLEESFYSAMFIRDVNAYVAVDERGKVKKRKGGPFTWVHGSNLGAGELAWHQDHSELVVPKAVEATLMRGEDVERFIRAHRDPFDFMCLLKASSGHRTEINGRVQSKHLRYYVSKTGGDLVKVMPAEGPIGHYKVGQKPDPEVLAACTDHTVWDERIHTKKKSTYQERRIGVKVGYRVRCCNRAEDFDWDDLDYGYYVDEARKTLASVGWGR